MFPTALPTGLGGCGPAKPGSIEYEVREQK